LPKNRAACFFLTHGVQYATQKAAKPCTYFWSYNNCTTANTLCRCKTWSIISPLVDERWFGFIYIRSAFRFRIVTL